MLSQEATRPQEPKQPTRSWANNSPKIRELIDHQKSGAFSSESINRQMQKSYDKVKSILEKKGNDV